MKHRSLFADPRVALIALLALILSAWPARAADAVAPATVTFSCVRDEAVQQISDQSYYDGTSLIFTNCIFYVGTSTNTARQGLNTVTIDVRVGNVSTSVPYTGTAQVETNGTWALPIIVPTNINPIYVQFKLTDSTTNIYIYPWKTLNRKSPL